MAVDDGLDLAVSLGGNDGNGASGFEIVADEVGVVPLVGQQHPGGRTGLLHDRIIALHVRGLAAAQTNRDREALSVAAEMDLGREAASRAAKTLVLILFLSAPAACWWARMMVESII